MVARSRGAGLPSEADVVAERMLAVMTDNSGEAVERAGDCARRWGRRS